MPGFVAGDARGVPPVGVAGRLRVDATSSGGGVVGCAARDEGWAMLEDPGRFYWKWLATGAGLLIVYAIERTFRTGSLF